MSLLDQNIKTIFGVEPKYSWKEYLRGVRPILNIKDQQEANLGKFQMKDKKDNLHSLYHPDGNLWLRFNQYGTFNVNAQIWDSEHNFIAKTDSKTKLTSKLLWLENAKGEKILTCKNGVSIFDPNENLVAELEFKRLRKDFTLRIIDTNLDKLLILAFSLALLINQEYGFEGSDAAGG